MEYLFYANEKLHKVSTDDVYGIAVTDSGDLVIKTSKKELLDYKNENAGIVHDIQDIKLAKLIYNELLPHVDKANLNRQAFGCSNLGKLTIADAIRIMLCK